MNTLLLSDNTILLSESTENPHSSSGNPPSPLEDYLWSHCSDLYGLPPSVEEVLKIQSHPSMQAALIELERVSRELLNQIRYGH
ncbi:MAG: hypothetical protein QNJ46_02820 [Leptolyngbyaceae cyanobacterium MO_188.B28]|nr:hypothetical protein [Leptolyngbyaceae cyanobacterium MO_188.B28]